MAKRLHAQYRTMDYFQNMVNCLGILRGVNDGLMLMFMLMLLMMLMLMLMMYPRIWWSINVNHNHFPYLPHWNGHSGGAPCSWSRQIWLLTTQQSVPVRKTLAGKVPCICWGNWGNWRMFLRTLFRAWAGNSWRIGSDWHFWGFFQYVF